MKVPFLATLTEIVATPLELVLAEKVLPFTLMVIFLLAINLLPDFKVTLTFLAFLTFLKLREILTTKLSEGWLDWRKKLEVYLAGKFYNFIIASMEQSRNKNKTAERRPGSKLK